MDGYRVATLDDVAETADILDSKRLHGHEQINCSLHRRD